MAPEIGSEPGAVEWRISDAPVPYEEAVAEMERRVAAIRDGSAPELVWLLEHPPLYTAGTSARAEDLLDPGRLPVHRSGRGGQYTYHGPGQRIAYVHARPRPTRSIGPRRALPRVAAGGVDHRRPWRASTSRASGATAGSASGSPGSGGREDKIAAIGVRVRHWVSYHGVALNVDPDLDHFRGIVPVRHRSGSTGTA